MGQQAARRLSRPCAAMPSRATAASQTAPALPLRDCGLGALGHAVRVGETRWRAGTVALAAEQVVQEGSVDRKAGRHTSRDMPLQRDARGANGSAVGRSCLSAGGDRYGRSAAHREPSAQARRRQCTPEEAERGGGALRRAGAGPRGMGVAQTAGCSRVNGTGVCTAPGGRRWRPSKARVAHRDMQEPASQALVKFLLTNPCVTRNKR